MIENYDKLIKRTAAAVGVDISLICGAFGFDLLPSYPPKKCDGAVLVTDDALLIVTDGTLTDRIPVAGVEFTLTEGVGSSTLEYSIGGEERILCRGGAAHTKEYSYILRRLRRMAAGGRYDREFERRSISACEKCHRPIPSGGGECPHCAKKGGYISRLVKLAWGYKYYLLVSIALYVVITGLNLLAPQLNRVLVDDYIKADTMPAFASFAVIIMMILAVSVMTRLLTMARGRTMIRVGTGIIVSLRSTVFNAIQRLSMNNISRRTSGELITRVTGDTATVQQFVSSQMEGMLEQILLIITVGAYLFITDWRMALMIIIPAPGVMIAHRMMWNYLGKRYGRQWTEESRNNSVLHDIFSGIRVVKSYGTEKREEARYDASAARVRDISRRNEILFAYLNPIVEFFMGLGEFFVLYYCGRRILGGEMTLGEMQVFASYTTIIYGPLRWMANLPRQLARVSASVTKIYEIVDEKSDVAERADALRPTLEGSVEFRGVSFGYDGGADVLHGINFTVRPGEMIGIVGHSGAGKSTLINLVMRMYDPEEGAVLIDGHNLRDISRESLCSQMGVVLQETFLFSGTVYDNIAYAKPDASREEIITAAKEASAHDFIMKLPDGYNTIVGEHGYTLSGGERQRIAIARALLHDPKILILDEATSSLDTETERQIQDALSRLSGGRTTLAIAHRLSTLRGADRLIVLDKGKLIECGSHDELMHKKGKYYDLVMAQRVMTKMKPA